MINFVNVDTTPSEDWSSYRIASNASLTVCFVMIGASLAIAGSGEVVIIADVVVNDVAIVAAMDRFTKFRRVLTMEVNSADSVDDDDDDDEMYRLKKRSSDVVVMAIVSSPSRSP